MDSHTSPTPEKAVISPNSNQGVIDFDHTCGFQVLVEEFTSSNMDNTKILHMG